MFSILVKSIFESEKAAIRVKMIDTTNIYASLFASIESIK